MEGWSRSRSRNPKISWSRSRNFLLPTPHPWINDYIQEEEDFKLVKELNTREENNRHYIIKCTPEIRKQIFIRGEILYRVNY